ncbi:MAG: DsbA family protein, partial [Cocleimonas sp.]|nr:DsbA family protein [Cocleimonas sp.]
TKPSDVAEHWQHVADYFKQPIDPSVWLKDPLSNSIILCKATLAVRQLAPQLESHFLRRMREHIFLFAKNLSRENLLLDCIQEFNIDTNKFTQLLHSNSLHQLFINEQQEMHQLGAMGFPSLVMPSKQPPSLLVGSQSYAQIEKALLTSKEDIKHKKLNSNEQLLSFPSWTLREACEVLQCNESTADTQLKQANFKSIAVAGSKFYQIENM